MPYISELAKVSYGEEAYGSFGTAPTTKNRSPGLVVGGSHPGLDNDLKTIRAIGGGRDLLQVALGKQKVEGLSLNLIVQDWRFLAQAMGAVADTGTDVVAGGGSTLNGATAIGATTVVLTAATGYVVNDYIHVDTGASSEIRKVTVVATNTLTLDEPLRKAHLTGVACNEVMAPFTHAIIGGNLMVDGKNQFHNTIEVAYTEGADDVVFQYNGCMLDSAELDCEEGDMVKATLNYTAGKASFHNTPETVTISSVAPYLFSQGELTWNAVTVARLKNVKLSVNNNGAAKHYIRDVNGRYAYEYIPAKREYKLSAEIVVDDDTILADFTAATERAVVLTFERTASTDTVTFSGTVAPEKMKFDLPESGEVGGSVECILKTLTVSAIDSVDHY